MTSLPQTQQRASAVSDARYRSASAAPGTPSAGNARDRARQPLPAVDPSKEFGCVDWFLYPDAAAEAHAAAVRA